jgi:hypothetical protein
MPYWLLLATKSVTKPSSTIFHSFSPSHYRVTCQSAKAKPYPQGSSRNSFMENTFEIKLTATSLSSSSCVLFPEWPSAIMY